MSATNHLGTDRRSTLRVAAIACLISFCFVLLHLWDNRDLFDPEGISYLDIADAYRRGDWHEALAGIWSPMYPWLLAVTMMVFNPSAQWEFTSVHALNVVIYLFALASFSVFLRELLKPDGDLAESQRLPNWAWVVLGYSLFTWGTNQLIPLCLPQPDMLVAGFVFLLLAVLLRIRKGIVTWGEATALGVLMALSYFAKAVMFPMAFVFTTVALGLTRRSRVMWTRILVSFVLFLSLSAPFIVALSNANGHWTYSEVGKLNYAWDVNGVKLWIHWQGENAGHGTPLHPTRKINEDPPMFEFATPIKATYPPWYNPSYWYEGVKTTVDLKAQIKLLLRNTKHLLLFLANSPGPAIALSRASGEISRVYEMTLGPLLVLLCAMILINVGRVPVLCEFTRRWFLLLPVAAAFGAYSLLHVEGRLIVGYVVALWMVLFRAAATPVSLESRRAFTAILATAALVVSYTLIPGATHAIRNGVRYLSDQKPRPPFLQSGTSHWMIAEHLKSAGVRKGDPVGSIGYGYGVYWARMGRFHVVTEIPEEGAQSFWSSDAAKQARVLELFRRTGSKAVVGNGIPWGITPAGWERIGDTGYYVHVFPREGQ